MFKRLLSCSLMLWAAVAAAAGNDLVIPAAGSAPGANGSHWQSEVTLHNSGADDMVLHLNFHTGSGQVATRPFTLKARETVSFPDIVAAFFGREGSTGGITIDVAEDAAVGKLAATSRTFNLTDAGEFGQDIPAFPVAQALAIGDTGVIPGPSNAADNRFNFGVFSLAPSTVEWRLLRRDGSVAATVEQTYEADVQLQYNGGTSSLLNQTAQNNDVIHARLISGSLFVYGSIVNQRTGDPTYVPSSRTRENLRVIFLGVDLDENGTVDIADANGDGVLDSAITVSTSRFPTFFQVVAQDPEGKTVTFTLVNAPNDAVLIDTKGTIQMYPGADRIGRSDVLLVRASDGTESTDFRIPLLYQ